MKKIIVSAAALALGVALASAPAFAQTAGPSGVNFGAGSNPQTGGTNYQAAAPQTGARTSKPLYNVAPRQNDDQGVVGGPAGPHFGAGSSALTR